MILFTPFVIFTFTAVGNVVSETYKKGGVAVLSPGSVSGTITSITWKHGPDIAVEWYGQEMTAYRDFKGRCEVNINTGTLTISNLSLKDSGRYTAEINNKIMKTTEIKVITAVPKPTIKKQCNSELTRCTLTCNANITADMGTVTYSWKTGNRQIPDSPSNQLNITKDNTESVGKLISCQLKNLVSSERSDDIMSPITNESSQGGITAAGVIVFIVLVALIVLGLLVHYLIWRNHRAEGENAGCRQYVAWFKTRCCPNCAERNTGTQSADDPVTGVAYTTVPTQDGQAVPTQDGQAVPTQDGQPVSTGIGNGAAIPANKDQPEAEPPGTTKEAERPESTLNIENETRSDQTPAEPTGTSSEAATSSESQTMKNQDQPETEATGTNKEAAAIPESQEDPNQHQPEAEPTGTNNGAETSAEAPNAEETPDHHHQQQDETTE